jgi:putative transposase
MTIPPRTALPGTFFVSSATADRRRLFQVPANAALFLETLQGYRQKAHFKLHAFVVMPDHVHLLLTPTGLSIERVVGLIKGGFSHRVRAKSAVWQRGFTDHRIRDREDYLVRLEYIHQNPVKARLVERAEDYPFSSAFRG